MQEGPLIASDAVDAADVRPRRELAELRMAIDRESDGSDLPADTDQAAESEPDARFTYANERTFLAWNRTALALIATGVAATQLLPKFQVAWGRRLLGLPLIALGSNCRYYELRELALERAGDATR